MRDFSDVPPEDAPMPVVGGPLHGRVYSFKGHILRAVYPAQFPVTWPGRRDAPQNICLEETAYRRQQFHMAFGTLTLSGWVWMWQDLRDDHAATAALGLLLAYGMRESPKPKDHAAGGCDEET